MHWGRRHCSGTSNSRLYSGVATTNSAGNPLCVPQPCGDDLCGSSTIKSPFDLTDWEVEKVAEIAYIKDGQPWKLDCSLCFIKDASTSITIPGANKCPKDWCPQYTGVLSQVWESTGQFICVDPSNFPKPPERPQHHKLAAVERNCFLGSECKDLKEEELRVPCIVCSFSTTKPCLEEIY